MSKTELMLLSMTEGRPTMTDAEVAKYLGVTMGRLKNMISMRTAPVKMFKLGSNWHAHVSDFAFYIEQQRLAARMAGT